MTPINTSAETAYFFVMLQRLRKAPAPEVEEIVDTFETMRIISPCAAIRLRCTQEILKHRGLRARIANGAIAAMLALSISFIVEATALDGIITCLDKIA